MWYTDTAQIFLQKYVHFAVKVEKIHLPRRVGICFVGIASTTVYYTKLTVRYAEILLNQVELYVYRIILNTIYYIKV